MVQFCRNLVIGHPGKEMLAKKSDTAMDEEVKQEGLNGIQDLFSERWLQNMDASKMLLGVEIAWEEGRG